MVSHAVAQLVQLVGKIQRCCLVQTFACQDSELELNYSLHSIQPVKLMQMQSKAKQRCVMGVGMCLYAQLVQTKNK